MYIATIALLMLVFPLASIVIDHAVAPAALPWLALIGKWFVFWCVGVRLVLAGLRQMAQPRFTAREIFGMAGDEALPVVQELGIANLALGAVAVLSLGFASFVLPAAIAGAIFYGVAGIRHARDVHRNAKQNLAMASDMAVALVLAAHVGFRVAA